MQRVRVDLGAPNEGCGGPGIGDGGAPGSEFENCMPQGNLIIIHNNDLMMNPDPPNDSGEGGCIKFEFFNKVKLSNMGLLDLESSGKITVSCSLGMFMVSVAQ